MKKVKFDGFIGSIEEKKIIENGFNGQFSDDFEKKLFLDTIKKHKNWARGNLYYNHYSGSIIGMSMALVLLLSIAGVLSVYKFLGGSINEGIAALSFLISSIPACSVGYEVLSSYTKLAVTKYDENVAYLEEQLNLKIGQKADLEQSKKLDSVLEDLQNLYQRVAKSRYPGYEQDLKRITMAIGSHVLAVTDTIDGATKQDICYAITLASDYSKLAELKLDTESKITAQEGRNAYITEIGGHCEQELRESIDVDVMKLKLELPLNETK